MKDLVQLIEEIEAKKPKSFVTIIPNSPSFELYRFVILEYRSGSVLYQLSQTDYEKFSRFREKKEKNYSSSRSSTSE